MRRRHRHFNPLGAGATAVFDARYISGASDGDSVSSWTSRTGSNSISQSNSSYQPVYKTNRLNGNPTVLWDGGANDELTFSSALTYSDFSVLIVYKNADVTNGSVVFARNNNTTGYAYYATNQFTMERALSVSPNYQQAVRTHNLGNVFLIAASTAVSGGNFTSTVNGTSGSTVSNANASSLTTTGIGKYSTGANNAYNTDGDLGLAVLANVAWPSSLRRRCEHAAAYSFKIACN